MKIIPQNYENDKKVSSSIINFFIKYKISSIESFHMIMQIFMETISDKLSLTSGQLVKIMDSFLLVLPKQFKGSLGLCA